MRALATLSRFVGNTFALWVLVFAVLAFLQPQWFIALKVAIVPLLGLVMFGMGSPSSSMTSPPSPASPGG